MMMSNKHEMKLMDNEINELRNQVFYLNGLLDKITEWLEKEIEMNQDVADAKDNKEDYVTSDGTDDIIYGRHECATGLLNLIKKWESEDE
tara:strand:+ start:455 stop:724 length:270 start_codon:yes stop_codon:yes gene_type:complete